MQVVEHRPPAAAALRYDSSSVFLNGPIQGAPDWQAHAIARFRSVPSDLLQLDVLNPRRLSLGPDFDYAEQVAWEKANRKRASRYGSVLLFWFAAQDHSLEYPAGRPYAKTTKKELDELLAGKIIAHGSISRSVSIQALRVWSATHCIASKSLGWKYVTPWKLPATTPWN